MKISMALVCLFLLGCSSDSNVSVNNQNNENNQNNQNNVNNSNNANNQNNVNNQKDVGIDAPVDQRELAPNISQAALCDVGDSPRLSVAPGTDLMKVTLDDPLAICNDGTPAVVYIRPAQAGGGHEDDWVVWLEGGGACSTGETCADRYCQRHPVYSAAKMSSAYAPDGVRGLGIFSASPPNGFQNNFAAFNQVFAYYCSSDGWVGTGDGELEFDGTPFSVTYHGHHIVNAIFDQLKVGMVSDDSSMTLPTIDDANNVLFTGTSAGSGGMRQHVDRIGDVLRATNPGVRYRAVADAGVHNGDPDPPDVPESAVEEAHMRSLEAVELRQGILDESCLAAHPDEQGYCANSTHVLLHHVTTPFFVKMDLSDSVNSPGPYPDGMSFSRAVYNLMNEMGTLDQWSEENDQFTPGIFAPNCGHHVNLESADFFRVGLQRNGNTVNNHDVMWNWYNDMQPDVIVHDPPNGTDSICP